MGKRRMRLVRKILSVADIVASHICCLDVNVGWWQVRWKIVKGIAV